MGDRAADSFFKKKTKYKNQRKTTKNYKRREAKKKNNLKNIYSPTDMHKVVQ